jgi:hypothetical protein
MKYKIIFKATDFKYIEKDRKEFANKLNSKLDPMFMEIKNYFENKYKDVNNYRKGKAYYAPGHGHNMNSNSVYKYLSFSYGKINFRYNLTTGDRKFIFTTIPRYPDFKLDQEDLNFLKKFNFIPGRKQDPSYLQKEESKIIDSKGMYGKNRAEDQVEKINGIDILISSEGNEKSKAAILKSVQNYIKTNNLSADLIDSIMIYETSIIVESKDEEQMKSGAYKIAQAQTIMMKKDGGSQSGIDYELVPVKADDSLYENIHAKRKRIEAGSKERMKRPGEEGRPSKQDFKDAAKTSKK